MLPCTLMRAEACHPRARSSPQYNQLKGTIPASIGNLTTLMDL